VRSHASLSKVQKNFLLPLARKTRSPSDSAFPRVGAAARAAGGMREYGEYPIKHPKPPAGLKTKNKTGVTHCAARRFTGW
jgi:hypothetical protein